MLFRLLVINITVTIVTVTNSSIIAIFNVSVIKNLTLSSLLPLLLVFLFLFLLLLHFFVSLFYLHCCYSYQVDIIFVSIINFVNFLIYTFAFHLLMSASQVFF